MQNKRPFWPYKKCNQKNTRAFASANNSISPRTLKKLTNSFPQISHNLSKRPIVPGPNEIAPALTDNQSQNCPDDEIKINLKLDINFNLKKSLVGRAEVLPEAESALIPRIKTC